MSDELSLGVFLRARREQLHPEDVGLPARGRRRTPGLRREEVATLAGVSVDYLIRIEQGRDLKPSSSVVAALANALRLSEDERAHLTKLAAIGASPELCPSRSEMQLEVAPNVRSIIERLSPVPAFLAGPAGHVLAWNAAWSAIVAPLGILDGESPNLAQYVFTHPRAREVFPDWERAADEQASQLRASSLRWGTDPVFLELLEVLGGQPEFARRWSMHGVGEPRRGITILRHPAVGELRIGSEVLQLPDDGEQRLTTWFPADEASEVALRSAIGQSDGHRALRIVRGA